MKPISFNTEMVRAILEDRKTVTRRVVKPQPEGAHTVLDGDEEAHTFDLMCGNGGEGGRFVDWAETVKAPFWPGDILYVRETWAPHQTPNGIWYGYKADGDFRGADYRWYPSIHMPKEAARIFLRVTGVRVERLQDMYLADCLKEGVQLTLIEQGDLVIQGVRARDRFAGVWDTTIKPADLPRYGWEADPWVWVIEFERVSRDEALAAGKEGGKDHA